MPSNAALFDEVEGGSEVGSDVSHINIRHPDPQVLKAVWQAHILWVVVNGDDPAPAERLLEEHAGLQDSCCSSSWQHRHHTYSVAHGRASLSAGCIHCSSQGLVGCLLRDPWGLDLRKGTEARAHLRMLSSSRRGRSSAASQPPRYSRPGSMMLGYLHVHTLLLLDLGWVLRCWLGLAAGRTSSLSWPWWRGCRGMGRLCPWHQSCTAATRHALHCEACA